MEASNIQLPVIFIMGPTASGKTALAIELIQKRFSTNSDGKGFKGYEIISVDSTLVYKQLNIGSAKPKDEELIKAPHHLINLIDPKERYSVSHFYNDAFKLIKEIHQRGKIPLLVGGTMLYFKSLVNGIADMPATDIKVRDEIQHRLKTDGVERLHSELETLDPVTAKRLHTNDSQRITRALEVVKMSGKPLSKWHEEQAKHVFPYKLLSLAIAPTERKTLHLRIEGRFDKMLEEGFLNEMHDLYHRGDLSLDLPSMRSVGYRQYWQYMDGSLSLNEAKERAVIATRQLAKRQLTWLRSWPDVHWFDLSIDSQNKACHDLIDEFVI